MEAECFHLHCLKCLFLQVIEAMGNRTLVVQEQKQRESSDAHCHTGCWTLKNTFWAPRARFSQVLSIYETFILKSIRTWTPSFVCRYLTLRFACLSEGTQACDFYDSNRIFTSVSSYLIQILKMTLGTYYLGLAYMSFVKPPPPNTAIKAMQLKFDQSKHSSSEH